MADNDKKNAQDFSMQTQVEHIARERMSGDEVSANLRAKIIVMARHAEDTFGLGVRYFVISQKLNRTAIRYGISLDTLLTEMDKAGEIFVYTDENYSRLIMVPEMREYYQLGVLGEETPETRNFIRGKWGRKGKGVQYGTTE